MDTTIAKGYTTVAVNTYSDGRRKLQIAQYLPFLDWLVHYRRENLVGDVMAGVIVAIMLVPQGMAYAMLAGLPPQIGLYASIAPVIIYGLLGTSRVLAVGPVALVSLLVMSGVGALAEPGSANFIQLALTLALMTGIIQMVMGVVRLGFLVNFLGHPILVGFTSAAAILIGFSQVKHVLGYAVPRTEYFYESVLYTLAHLGQTDFITLAVGAGSIAVMLYFKHGLGRLLASQPESLTTPITRSGPLVVVALATVLVWASGLHTQLNIVGDVPAGLPPLTLPTLDMSVWQALLPIALVISLVGYMESISVAKALASKRRQKVDADQELIALGAANLGATFTGGYPVTGGLSRSLVNFAAGANTGLASIITAGLIAFTVIFLTPLFYYLPNATLAAIILVAVVGLIDLKSFRHIWHYNKGDGAAAIVTFVAVLAVGVELGIAVGVGVSLLLFIWRTSRPHMAIVGRLGNGEVYRNVNRHGVVTYPEVIALRVDESLYFANTKYLEDTVLRCVAEKPTVKHFILIGTAINFIDASALETLESLYRELKDAGVAFHLTDIKGPVMDKLKTTDLIDHLGPDHIHLTIHNAMATLGYTD